MRVVIQSRFYPNLGGIETLANTLASEWVASGADVVVSTDVTCTAKQQKAFSFMVMYRPGFRPLLRTVYRADVIVQMNISLRALWPLAVVSRPLVAVHHGFYICDRSGRRDWREKLKLRVARRASANIAVSQAVARAIGVDCEIIPNAYDDRLFRKLNTPTQTGSLVFVGRLVSDKGGALLLEALKRLRDQGMELSLTVIGDGPERSSLEFKVAEKHLQPQVRFLGVLSPAQVAAQLRSHEILVIPSLVEESFGIVALEGAACGCVVLGSDGGGLPEAIGPAGLTFRRGDVDDLVAKIQVLLLDPEKRQGFRAAAPAHLQKHQPARVAARYLEVFERVLAK